MRKPQATFRQAKKPRPNWKHRMVYIFAIPGIALLLHGFWGQYHQPPLSKPPLTETQSATPAPMQFDFYTILPKMAVAPKLKSCRTAPNC